MRAAVQIGPALSQVQTASATLADVVYERIKEDLFEFRLLPGDHFTEADLVARLGVSRTPLRLALARLQRDGFLIARPRSGWQVHPIDFERFEALYDVRIVLELAAVDRLVSREALDPSGILGALQDVWLVPDDQRIRDGRLVGQLDEAFHCALVAAAGNPEMAAIHREVTEKIRIIRRLDFTQGFRVDATYDEHAAILRAILARRGTDVRQMLRAHIELSKAEVRKITLHRLYEARGTAGARDGVRG
ncbi:GntR family transcriptional regulator [Bordetella genomosp. 5]|uniref:GntR family transcriptional regulator n=1 Tax=Bordetella genomosp. 5 TaxID=1395608 RepID=A0A261T815_9BORD|nr:GntR family transcriptional regulator [Bordetella genomosp. 5]OZI45749.1 GntR family transcriptional regulator [Bordetella genomosp. 5]OZI46126.1 GntR family transcriptional regulator [Bordetella genomosp. 5]